MRVCFFRNLREVYTHEVPSTRLLKQHLKNKDISRHDNMEERKSFKPTQQTIEKSVMLRMGEVVFLVGSIIWAEQLVAMY